MLFGALAHRICQDLNATAQWKRDEPSKPWPHEKKVMYVVVYLPRIRVALSEFIISLFSACPWLVEPASVNNVRLVTLDSERGLDVDLRARHLAAPCPVGE